MVKVKNNNNNNIASSSLRKSPRIAASSAIKKLINNGKAISKKKNKVIDDDSLLSTSISSAVAASSSAISYPSSTVVFAAAARNSPIKKKGRKKKIVDDEDDAVTVEPPAAADVTSSVVASSSSAISYPTSAFNTATSSRQTSSSSAAAKPAPVARKSPVKKRGRKKKIVDIENDVVTVEPPAAADVTSSVVAASSSAISYPTSAFNTATSSRQTSSSSAAAKPAPVARKSPVKKRGRKKKIVDDDVTVEPPAAVDVTSSVVAQASTSATAASSKRANQKDNNASSSFRRSLRIPAALARKRDRRPPASTSAASASLKRANQKDNNTSSSLRRTLRTPAALPRKRGPPPASASAAAVSSKSANQKGAAAKKKINKNVNVEEDEEEEEGFYDVEEILRHKRAGDMKGYERYEPNELLFEVKWIDYIVSDNTWEKLDNVKRCEKFHEYCNRYLVPTIGRLCEDENDQDVVRFDFVEPVEGESYYLKDLPDKDESDICGDADFNPLDETAPCDAAFTPPPAKKQKQSQRRPRNASSKSKAARSKKDPEAQILNDRINRVLNDEMDAEYLLNQLRADEERPLPPADFFGGAPTIEEMFANVDENFYSADRILGMNDFYEPDDPPQTTSRRGRKKEKAPVAPKKKKIEKKVPERRIVPQDGRVVTRSMAAAVAANTTLFASLENPSPFNISGSFLTPPILDVFSSPGPQPSMNDDNSPISEPPTLDGYYSTVPQLAIGDNDSSAAPQYFVNFPTVPSSSDVHFSSTVPEPQTLDGYYSATAPQQDFDDINQNIHETPSENLVAGELYANQDGEYFMFDGEQLVQVEVYTEPEMPSVAIDSSHLPTSSASTLGENYYVNSETPSQEAMATYPDFDQYADDLPPQNDPMLMPSASSSEGYSSLENTYILSPPNDNVIIGNEKDNVQQPSPPKDDLFDIAFNFNLNADDTNDNTAAGADGDDGYDDSFFGGLDESTIFRINAIDLDTIALRNY